jgi:uncharacterized SAM-binding protein YcdF (DUF218 family)
MTYTEPLLTVALLLTLVVMVRFRRGKSHLISVLGILGLLLVSLPVVDWLVSRPLEIWYPVRPFASAPVQAIVVLPAAVHRPTFERPYYMPDGETYARCEFAGWLHKCFPDPPVLACGGAQEPGEQPYSATMRRLLERAGVPASLIWTEERSRSTHENALFCAQILQEHNIQRIALVVDAQSMLRAEASFRKLGITVVPAPCSFRELGAWSEELLPSWRAIRRNEASLHEILGLAWYRLHGWI